MKGLFLGFAAENRDKAPYSEEKPSLLCLQKELKNGRGQNWAKTRTAREKQAITVSRVFVWVWLCGCDCVSEENSV